MFTIYKEFSQLKIRKQLNNKVDQRSEEKKKTHIIEEDTWMANKHKKR